MMMTQKTYDLLTIGRISMDLFSLDIGAPFVEITGFSAHIGGSPTNIALAGSRLGLRTALLTALGQDLVGDFALHHLSQEGVDTRFIPRKENGRTGLAVLGIEPPDKFPLVFYRENPADIHLSIDDVQAVPLSNFRSLLLTGTNLSRGSLREATFFAAEKARTNGVTVFLDLDLRPDQWSHPRAFGLSARALLPFVDVVIGTEEEMVATLANDPAGVAQGRRLNQEEKKQLDEMMASWTNRPDEKAIFILKRGANGSRVYQVDQKPVDVPGFPVSVLNTVGAGDAFAAGLIYGYLAGMSWPQAARIANACGAIVVTRHGCAAAMPYAEEIFTFMREFD